MICNQADIAKLGTILGVWAHPDDETFSMGGIMIAAVRNGQTVACVTATRGEAGVQDPKRWPQKELGHIRTDELEASYKIMGVTHHTWLDYPDGGCKTSRTDDAVDCLVALIHTYNPESIMTFGPDGLTGHDDHKTVSKWADLAVKKAGSRAKIYHAIQTPQQYKNMLEVDKQFNLFFNIDQPPLCEEDYCAIHFVLDDDTYHKKLEALKAMPSQYEAMLKVFEERLHASLATEAFVRAD